MTTTKKSYAGGQYKYNPSSTYMATMTEQTTSSTGWIRGYINTYLDVDDTTLATINDPHYRDLIIYNSNGFEADKMYVLEINLDQSYTKELDISVLLTKTDGPDTTAPSTSNYQFLKHMTLPQAGSDEVISAPVIFYNSGTNLGDHPYYNKNKEIEWWDTTEEKKYWAMMPQEYDNKSSWEATDVGKIFYSGTNKKYYIGIMENSSYGAKECEDYVQLNGATTWIKDVSGQKMKRIVFKSENSDYNTILFKLSRDRLEASTYTSITNWGDVRGTVLSISELSEIPTSELEENTVTETQVLSPARLYSCSELIGTESGHILYASLYSLGVWGDNGTEMVISSNPIQIGPSSYYELHNFTVSSLGICAHNSKSDESGWARYKTLLEKKSESTTSTITWTEENQIELEAWQSFFVNPFVIDYKYIVETSID